MKLPYEIIQEKAKSCEHTDTDIHTLVEQFTNGEIPDYQMSAWLMAVFLNGMSHQETLAYTHAMIHSGVQLDFSHLPGFIVDKHSTGGVGDKISLILGPILSACGCYVPMLSGRGLGHTGGTLDKLESIHGYKTSISLQKFKQIVKDCGVSIIGQTNDICPADKKIYALRDVTATVASNSLICGSIMSKKIAEGIQGLVLDIKVGNGAFMKTMDEAKSLGNLLSQVGELYGLKIAIHYSDMNQVLGNTAGIWCEVQESIDVLQGNGPNDVIDLTKTLCMDALSLAGIEQPATKVQSVIDDGTAYEVFEKMVLAHGGSLKNSVHTPAFELVISAQSDGTITSMNTEQVGFAIIEAGGGRKTQIDTIDNSAGIKFSKKCGDTVDTGEEICRVFGNDQNKLESAKNILRNCFSIK
jgi:pyrimidine-nucleoside phosphorylase